MIIDQFSIIVGYYLFILSNSFINFFFFLFSMKRNIKFGLIHSLYLPQFVSIFNQNHITNIILLFSEALQALTRELLLLSFVLNQISFLLLISGSILEYLFFDNKTCVILCFPFSVRELDPLVYLLSKVVEDKQVDG